MHLPPTARSQAFHALLYDAAMPKVRQVHQALELSHETLRRRPLSPVRVVHLDDTTASISGSGMVGMAGNGGRDVLG
jgi:hypothetical protein